MNYMNWAAMGAASSAYAEASRARSENQDLWHQNQMLSNELGRLQSKLGQYQDELGQIQGELGDQQDVLAQYHNKLGQQQDVLDEIRKDIARKKAIQEYQAWIEEFIYKFSKAVTNLSSGSKDPVNDYDVITSFLDIINKNSLDTSRIRGLENKSAFEQVFVKAQNLFDELEKNPEVQNHKHRLQEARLEEERKKELARAEQIRRKQMARSEQLRKQEEARLDQKRQAEKSRLKQLREQKQRQLQKEQIVSASEALVKSSAKEWEGTTFLLKIIGTLAAILILSGIIHSWVSQPEKQGLYPINQDNHIERTDTFTKGSKQQGVDTIDQTNAQAKIAWTYYNGDGVAKDYAEALKWFSLAADGGIMPPLKLISDGCITTAKESP